MTKTEERFQEIQKKLTATCSCGRKHDISLKGLLLHKGALSELPKVIASLGEFRCVTMVCDENTYKAAGEQVEKICDVQKVVLNPENLHANEHGVDLLEKAMPAETDLFLAVGSGTIHDITRYVSYQHHIQFISVPTAASVDGFVSTVAAMTWNGVKRTLTAVGPTVMVADSEVIAKAPMRLTAAGVGDLLGKYTALTDWKIGRVLLNEYYCEEIVRLEEEALKELVDHIDEIAKGDIAATEILMYGLVLSGLAMQMAGNSRPASGSEHHISHLIEMGAFGPNEAYHGEKVGVGTGIVCDYYHKVAKLSGDEITFDPSLTPTRKEIEENFGDLTEEIVKENANEPLKNLTADILKAHWEEVQKLLTSIPSGDEVRALIGKLNGTTTLTSIGLPDISEEKVLRISPLVRNRLTMVRIMRFFK